MKRPFLTGFSIGLLIFILLNILATQLRSDCGLAALFGQSHCADNISRAGFPLIFYEEGGFVYRQILDSSRFLLDIFVGLGFGIASGFANRWYAKRR